jgi:hypothetical protein
MVNGWCECRIVRPGFRKSAQFKNMKPGLEPGFFCPLFSLADRGKLLCHPGREYFLIVSFCYNGGYDL